MSPKKVEECVQSVMEDNPEYDKSRAYAICNAANNRGELENVKPPEEIEMQEDPCWDGYTMVGTKTDENGNTVPRCVPEEDVPDAEMAYAEASDCPDGQVRVNDECVPVEEVADVPPSSLKHAAVKPKRRIFRARTLEGAIERIEQDDGSVRYTNISLLSPGKWTDSASRQTIHYSERGIGNMQVTPDNTLNLMHDVDPETGEANPASEIGHIDHESARQDDSGALVADIVLHMDNAASEYADENLQSALESDGRVGFGGPSVEIPADGQELERNGDVMELVQGKVDGAGLVMEPASKTVDFRNQTAEKGVALAAESERVARKTKGVYLKEGDMTETDGEERDLMDAEDVRGMLEGYGLDTGDMDDEDVLSVAEEMHDDLMGMMEDDEEDAEMGEYEDDEEDEEEDTEMEDDDGVSGADELLEEEIDELWDKVRKIEESMMDGEEMQQALSEAREELADAETVKDLEKQLAEMDKSLSQGRTLAEGKTDEEEEFEPLYDDGVSPTSRW